MNNSMIKRSPNRNDVDIKLTAQQTEQFERFKKSVMN